MFKENNFILFFYFIIEVFNFMKKLKRLIKISEFFSSGKRDEITYNCYINPTNKEWNDVNKDSGGNIRGFISENGTLYIGDGNITHDKAINLFSNLTLNPPISIPIEDTKIKISIETGSEMPIQYINSNSLDNKSIILALQKCQSLLNFFNKNTTYIGFYSEFPIGDLGDIVDFKG